jgi:methionine synthase I (cobalamin-dependent)
LDSSSHFLWRTSGRADALEPLVDAAAEDAAGHPLQGPDVREELPDLHLAVHAPLLGEIADEVLRVGRRRLAQHRDLPLIRVEDRHHHADGGGLPRRRWAPGIRTGSRRGRPDLRELHGHPEPDASGDGRAIHRSFFEAGSDAVETNTFGTPIHVLDEFDLGAAFELSKQSAEIARAAADAFSTDEKPRFVLGSMGPGTKLITLGQITWDEMLGVVPRGDAGLIAGGADAILIETCQDLLQVKCAINAALAGARRQGKSPEEVPLMVSITIEQMGTMLVGSSLEAAVTALREYPVASIGLNCATGPWRWASTSSTSRAWDRAISCYPNAGLPCSRTGRRSTRSGPTRWPRASGQFVEPSTASRWSAAAAGRPPSTSRRWRRRRGP